MTVTFIADGSSWQGNIPWAALKRAGFGAGVEKATQGTSYENPFWPASRAALAAAAGPDFTPNCYLFLEAGNGAAQADWFAACAGNIAGFVIWVDRERSATFPSIADTQECVARLRHHFPRNRIGLYSSRLNTGGDSLTFADLLWSPAYVFGAGSPQALYQGVPASWWLPYGGRTPVMVQFTQSAQIAGISGLADCSAYRGTAAELHAALLGTPAPKPPPPPAPIPAPEDDMIMIQAIQADVPKSTPWPGVYMLYSNGTMRHITGSQGDASNVAAYTAAGIKGPVQVSWEEWQGLLQPAVQ